MRIAYLEGPPSERLAGWSHFLLCVGTKPPAPFMTQRAGAEKRAASVGAKFYQWGTWEDFDTGQRPAGTLAKPSPHVLAWLEGREQAEAAL